MSFDPEQNKQSTALRDLVRVYEGRDPQPTAASIDPQSAVPRATRGYDAGKRVNGRKRHIAVDTGGLLLAAIVTMAGMQDRDAAHRLLARLRERVTTIALIVVVKSLIAAITA